MPSAAAADKHPARSGALPGGGALDYYSFEADQGETLRFDALTTGGLGSVFEIALASVYVQFHERSREGVC